MLTAGQPLFITIQILFYLHVLLSVLLAYSGVLYAYTQLCHMPYVLEICHKICTAFVFFSLEKLSVSKRLGYGCDPIYLILIVCFLKKSDDGRYPNQDIELVTAYVIISVNIILYLIY